MSIKESFQKFAHRTAEIAGSPGAFSSAAAFIVIWAFLGPHFHYSEDWQLVVNTATTIITFLMVFLIQNAQNRDSRAVHMKLNELIRSNHHARNECIELENCTEEELSRLEAEYKTLREHVEERFTRIKEQKHHKRKK